MYVPNCVRSFPMNRSSYTVCEYSSAPLRYTKPKGCESIHDAWTNWKHASLQSSLQNVWSLRNSPIKLGSASNVCKIKHSPTFSFQRERLLPLLSFVCHASSEMQGGTKGNLANKNLKFANFKWKLWTPFFISRRRICGQSWNSAAHICIVFELLVLKGAYGRCDWVQLQRMGNIPYQFCTKVVSSPLESLIFRNPLPLSLGAHSVERQRSLSWEPQVPYSLKFIFP
jgi:hypothetical protein